MSPSDVHFRRIGIRLGLSPGEYKLVIVSLQKMNAVLVNVAVEAARTCLMPKHSHFLYFSSIGSSAM